MSSHASVAAKVRRDKEAHPENYCSNRQCLWRTVTRTGTKPCPKHSVTPEQAKEFSRMIDAATNYTPRYPKD